MLQYINIFITHTLAFIDKLLFTKSFMIKDEYTVGCKCPPGFKGDGINNCEGNYCLFPTS